MYIYIYISIYICIYNYIYIYLVLIANKDQGTLTQAAIFIITVFPCII